MANNYEQIMALVDAGNKMGLSNTITRDNGIPLDLSSVYSSYNDAVVYAATKAIAYHGQPVAVITETDATLYVITPVSQGKTTIGETEYDVYLKQVGSKTLGDDKSIVLSDDGVLSLFGFEAAENQTLPRKNSTTGLIEWLPIDKIVDGDGNTKTVVEVAQGSALSVTSNHVDDTDTYTYTLDVTLPAVPEYSVTKVTGDDVVTYTVTKDGNTVGESIVVPNAYDDSGLDSRISAVESSASDHKTRIENIEAFFTGAAADEGNGESLVEALDTLKEIQDYINSDGQVSQTVLSNKTAIETLNGDVNTAGSVANAIAAQAAVDAGIYATQAALAEVKTTADAAAVKAVVDAALAKKVETATIARTSDGVVEGVTVEGTVLKIVVDAFSKEETLAKIDEKITSFDGGETASAVKALLNSYKETNDAEIAALKTANTTQNDNIQANTDAIAAINAEDTGFLAQARVDAQTRVDALAAGAVATNTGNITALDGKITSINNTISTINSSIAALEQHDTDLNSAIGAEKTAREELNKTVSSHTTSIASLETKDGEFAALIAANSTKFNSYSTTTEVETKIADAIRGIDYSNINNAISANTKAIEDEATRADEEEKRLAGLISDNDTAIKNNAAAIAALDTAIQAVIDDKDGTTLNSIKDLATWISEHDDPENGILKAVNDNTSAIEKLNGDVNTAGSIKKSIAEAIAAIPAIGVATTTTTGVVKASSEVTVSTDGTLGIGYVSTDKLIQGSGTLILNGGTAEVNVD